MKLCGGGEPGTKKDPESLGREMLHDPGCRSFQILLVSEIVAPWTAPAQLDSDDDDDSHSSPVQSNCCSLKEVLTNGSSGLDGGSSSAS